MKKALLATLLLGVGLLIWPAAAAQEPPPLLSTVGIDEIQEVPERTSRFFTEPDATRILESIANAAVMQLELEGFPALVENPVNRQIETVQGGEFARILLVNALFPAGEEGLLVDHFFSDNNPDLPEEFEEDRFRLNSGGRDMDLFLARLAGRPDRGFDWGVVELRAFLPYLPADGLGRSQVFELIMANSTAIITQRVFAPSGRLQVWAQWTFVGGNPDPVSERPLGP